MSRKFAVSAAAIAAMILAGAIGVNAQQPGKGSGSMTGAGSGSGMMAKKKGMMGAADCPMMGHMSKGGDMAAHGDARIAALKTALAITPAQQGAWDAYASALKKNMTGMHAAHQVMMGGPEVKSPVARLDIHVTTMESRLASLKEVKPTLTALYAVFSDEQKKKANDAMSGGCGMM